MYHQPTQCSTVDCVMIFFDTEHLYKIKISSQLHVIEAQERHEKSPKKRQVVQADAAPRGESSYEYCRYTALDRIHHLNIPNVYSRLF